MQRFLHEIRHFHSYPWNMRVLIVTNMVYAFAQPVVETFVSAYIMHGSKDPRMVIAYAMALYTGIPFTFLVNGWLLRIVAIKRLYAAGMMLSAVSMIVMMSLGTLDVRGVGIAGLLMGVAVGFYWANRDFLALSSTNDTNRNYYYGLETFIYTLVALVVPIVVGGFIGAASSPSSIPWLSWLSSLGSARAYQIVTAVVFLVALAASIVIHRGSFTNPPLTRFVFFRYHELWTRFQFVAIMKGLTQGYISNAPAMLVMTLLGGEGELGAALSIGAVCSAILLYLLGRVSKPGHRIVVFGTSLGLFALGGLANAVLFNALSVLLFMLCLVLARPLHDFAYFPIQMWAIDHVAPLERRNTFAYILSHEFTLYLGRMCGMGLFLLIAFQISTTAALRYALLVIGVAQLAALPVARRIVRSRPAEPGPSAICPSPAEAAPPTV